MSRSTEIAGFVTYRSMHSTLRVLQLNVHKSDAVQHSLMNDEDIKDYGVVAVTEPHARMIEGQVVTSPMGHRGWTKMVPSRLREGRWPVRSLLWIREDIEAEQIPLESADLTGAILRLPEREVIVVSVYVEGQCAEALERAVNILDELISQRRGTGGRRMDVILAGDLNRHDIFWGGTDVPMSRQGKAEPLINLMNEHGLRSLLPQGTKTWQRAEDASTIDLMLASTELANTVVECQIHATDHGSDHRAIQTEFDVGTPGRHDPQRLLFKNAPWIKIRSRPTRAQLYCRGERRRMNIDFFAGFWRSMFSKSVMKLWICSSSA